MKRFCTLAAVALVVAGLAHGQACAWTNIRLRAGVEFNWQAGGNSYAWGLIHSGQPHDPSIFGGGFGGHPVVVAPDYGHYYGTGNSNGQPNGNGGNNKSGSGESSTSSQNRYSGWYNYGSYGYQPVNYPYYYYPGSYYYGY